MDTSALMLRAVVFDVDFTIARPGPDLGPEGYTRLGERYGLSLDPALYDDARRAALDTLERSSAACSSCSASPPTRLRWSATRSRTTSKARARSACGRCCSTGTGGIRRSATG